MMFDEKKISLCIDESIKTIEDELILNTKGTDRRFGEWYYELEEFRRIIANYIPKRGAYGLSLKLQNGEILDYHLAGYLAPMEFRYKGYGNIDRTPSSQIVHTAKQFERHGIRFIYLALPCKIAVYPEYAVKQNAIPQDGIVIPQWRKMLYEILKEKVEVIDMYPLFLKAKEKARLYSNGHSISCDGSELIGTKLAHYLQKTTKDISWNWDKNTIRCNCYDKGKKIITTLSKGMVAPYMGKEVESEISIFGNCNLQAFRGMGTDITAFTSYYMHYPIRYAGRWLPFSTYDSISNAWGGLFNGCKVAIYVGFPSSSWCRPIGDKVESWCTEEIPDEVFI